MAQSDDPDTPVISKSLPIIKWTEAFADHLHHCIGVRMIPLAYVIRESEDVDPQCPSLERDQPFSEVYRSIKEDMIHCTSHRHGLFCDHNAEVSYKLEDVTRGTAYADSIKPFQQAKNDRGAFLALKSQCAGKDKYEAENVKQDNLLHKGEWKGQSNFTLERFIQQHCNSYVSMKSCYEHVAYQLPNDHTCVGYLNAIKCDDAGLQAAIANILDDENGKRQDFEAAAAYLLPKDPVAKRRGTGQKRSSAEISGATAYKIFAKGKSCKV